MRGRLNSPKKKRELSSVTELEFRFVQTRAVEPGQSCRDGNFQTNKLYGMKSRLLTSALAASIRASMSAMVSSSFLLWFEEQRNFKFKKVQSEKWNALWAHIRNSIKPAASHIFRYRYTAQLAHNKPSILLKFAN